jgi:hypothetical protein
VLHPLFLRLHVGNWYAELFSYYSEQSVSFPAFPPYPSAISVGVPVKTVAMFKVRQQEVVST